MTVRPAAVLAFGSLLVACTSAVSQRGSSAADAAPGPCSAASRDCPPATGGVLAGTPAPAPPSLAAEGSAAPASPPETRAAPPALPFLENDFEGAVTEAKRRGVPLFVDVWAPWCHACASLRDVVFPDPALRPLADRFVWLAIDSERGDNEAFLRKFPPTELPMLWVVDPATQRPVTRWVGAVTAVELVQLLEDAALQASGAAPPAAAGATPTWLLATREEGLGHPARAIELLGRALREGGERWPRRAQASEALGRLLAESGRGEETIALALGAVPTLPPGTARLRLVTHAVRAVTALPTTAEHRAALARLAALGLALADDPGEPVLLDERSSFHQALVGAHRGEPDEARRLAARWLGLLESGAARLPPAERRVLDSHRLEACLALGEPARAIPALEQSEREVPDDYNPPSRLAHAYLALGRVADAEAAVQRALGRAAGPRKLRIYMQQADVRLAAGDGAGARQALQAALDHAEREKLPHEYDRLRAAVSARLRAIR